MRARRLIQEEAADEESRLYEEKEAENLRRESEAFLARQMDEMQALAEEQRKAGMLLDDGAPVKLNVSLQSAQKQDKYDGTEQKMAAFAQEEIDDIQETAKGTILVIVANRDERCWDTAGNANCVLDIEVCFNASVVPALRVRATVKCLEGKRRGGR